MQEPKSDGIERALGRLEEHAVMTKSRLEQIESKIDSLQSFKWKVIGISTVLSFLFTLAVDLLHSQ